MDVVSLCSDLIRCKSITPTDDDAIELVSSFLRSFGFETTVLTFSSSDGSNLVKNLFAKYGSSKKKVLGFLGHTDVVPPGNCWETDPFAALQRNGFLIGRGAVDMKGGISAFCCAVQKFIKQGFDGAIEFFITEDEEIGSHEGTPSLIKWMHENKYTPDDCLVGEPSSHESLGDRIFLGHRGSMNVTVKSRGKQGHSAYPENYENSLSGLCRYITKMVNYKWKHKDKRFPLSNLEPTLLFTNNYAANIVPEESSANLNIRFGGDYDFNSLKQIMLDEAKEFGLFLEFHQSGESYYCDNEKLKRLLSTAIKETINIDPVFSAAGGTSDGRHMIRYCNVIEFGPLDTTMHQKNERIKISDLQKLEEIYFAFLQKYFA